MPFNGSGVFQRVYDWTTDRDNGKKIIAERIDTETDGIVAGINDIVDGTQGFIGAVKGTNGTEGAPAFSFTDDPDTGVYRASANTLGVSVGGTQELKVEAGYVDAVNGLKIGGTETSVFTSTEKTKLGNIEDNADVTDATNVAAAGALMESDVTNVADVKAFDPADYATAAQGTKADTAQQPPSEGAFVDGDKTKLDGIEARATRNLAVDTFSDLADLTDADLDNGDLATVTETGWVVERVSTGEDYDYTGSGGVKLKLISANTNLKDRDATNAGIIANLPDGWFGTMAGLIYEVDSSLTGSDSCTNDLSVDGLKPAGEITPAHFGDDLFAALTYAGGAEVHLNKDLTISSAETYSGRVRLRGHGHTLDLTSGSVTFRASLDSLPGLNSDVSRFDTDIEFVSAHGLVEGDVFCIYDTNDGSWSDHRPSYHDGDWMRVAEVVSTTKVRIFGHAPDGYAKIDCTCHRITGEGVSIDDLAVVPPSSGEYFTIEYHQGVRLRGLCAPSGNSNRNFLIQRCYDIRIDDTQSTVLLGNAYPFTLSNCKSARITGQSTYSDRHVFSLGGAAGAGAVPTRDVVVDGYVASNLDTGNGALEAHGNCDNISYNNCIVDSGINPSGRNIRFHSCRIIGRTNSSDGSCVFGSEVVGGVYQFSDCEFVTSGDGAAFGILHLVAHRLESTYNSPAKVVGISEDLTLRIDNCTIRNLGSGSATMRAIIVHVGNSVDGAIATHQINIEVRGLTIDAPDTFAVVGIMGTNDVSSHASLLIEGLRAPQTQFTLMVASNSANYNMPMRMPMQTVTEEVSYTTAEASKVGVAQLFNWTYPRHPLAQVSAHTTDGSNYNPGTTNLAMPYLYDVEEGSLRMGIKTTDGGNFSIGDTVTLVGRAWIDDL